MKKLHSKNLITAVLATLCAALMCVGFALFSSETLKGGKSAEAAVTTNVISVDELTLNGSGEPDSNKGNKVFNGNNLAKLFGLITGDTSNGKTYDDVYKKIYGDSSVSTSGGTTTYTRSYVKYGNSAAYLPRYRSAWDIYNGLGNQNIEVTFGGQQWTVTFVTTNKSGDLVATLWLKDRLGGNSWTSYTGAHGWANSTNGGNQTSLYPGDMYSTSEVRVTTLNNGGQIATSASAVGAAVSQNASHPLANFTMTSSTSVGNKSLTQYIEQPKNMDYQYVESFAYHYTEAGTSYSYNIHNEALYANQYLDATGNYVTGNSTTVSGSWYSNFNYTAGNVSQSGVTGYSDWGNDYVWLPSLSETGCIAYGSQVPACTGIWGTVVKQGTIQSTGQIGSSGTTTAPAVSNWQSVANNTDGYTWLRSGDGNIAYTSHYLTASGANSATYCARTLAVRPALHLNLKSAAQAATQADAPKVQVNSDKLDKTSVDWDDKEKTFDLKFDTQKVAITKIEREAVGGTKDTLYTTTLPTTPTGTPTVTPNSNTNIKCDVGSAADGATLKLKQAGKYVITLNTVDNKFSNASDKYLSWADDGSNGDKTIEIYIFPKGLTKPEVAAGDKNGQEYTGKDITFTLASSDTSAAGDWHKYIKIDGTCPTDLTEAVYDSGDHTGERNGSFTAKKVGDYKFKLKLVDEENTVWKDSNGKTTWYVDTSGNEPVYYWSGSKGGNTDEIKLSVTQRTLTTQLTNSKNWTWSMGIDGVKIKVVISNFADVGHIDSSTPPSLTGTASTLGLVFFYTNADGTGETTIDASKVKATFDSSTGEVSFDGGTTKITTGTLTVEVTMPKINTTNDASNPNYVFGVKPDSGEMSKNYKVSTNSSKHNFTIGTAIIDLDTLAWTYNEDGVQATTTDESVPTNPVTNNTILAQNGHVTYKKNTQGTAAVEYEPKLMLYKETHKDDGTGTDTTEVVVDYEYNDSQSPVLQVINYSSQGGSVSKASNVNLDSNGDVIAYKTTVKLKLVDTNGYSLKATGNPSYIRVDATTNEAEIDLTWYIDRAKVDLSKVKYEYGWIDDNTGEVKWEGTYDANNKPSFRDTNVSIRVKGGTSYPEGITGATINSSDYLTDRDAPGKVTAKVNYTLDPNYYYENASNVKFTGTFTENGGIELAKKKIPVSWTLSTVKDSNGDDVLDANGLPYQIYVLDFGNDTDNLSQYIKYEYYYADVTDPSNPIVDTVIPSSASGTTTNAQLDYLIDVDGAGKFIGASTSTLAKPIFVRAVIDTSVTGSGNYELNVAAGSYAEQYTKFGQKKNLVDVTVIKSEIEYGSTVASLDDLYTLTKGTAKYPVSMYTAVIYKDTDSANAVDVASFDFSTANVGTYTVKFTLKPSAADSDALNKTSITIQVVPKEIEVPSVTGTLEFNSEHQSFVQLLDGKYQEYLDAGIIKPVSGMVSARDVAQNSYLAVIEIADSNYKWKTPAAAGGSTTKVLLKASLADDAVTTDVTLDAAAKEATYSWNIKPFRLDTSYVSTSNGQFLNSKLPAWAQQLITDETLLTGVKYYVDSACTEEVPVDENGNYVISKGKTYYCKPMISGDDAGNFTFATDGSITSTSEKAVTYQTKKSVGGQIKDAMTKTYAGLPLWAWLLIGLALLILLIIIIVVAVKRRKTKEEREEKKAAKQAAKEEAAAKAEAERARLESEREAERMRLENQREIEKMKAEAEAARAKAQAEAEIAKMRAQAQAQMPAMPQPMAMPQQMPMQQPVYQQQPQQMPVQQPVYQQPQPQPQYVQQPVNNNELAEIKKQLKKIRAEQRAQRYGAAMPQQQMPMYQQPNYGAAMAPAAYDASALAMAKLEAKLDNMHTEHSAVNAARMEAEMAKMRADMYGNTMHMQQPMYQQPVYQQPAQPAAAPVIVQQPVQQPAQPAAAPVNASTEANANNPSMLGEVLASMVRSLAAGQAAMHEAAVTSEPLAVEESQAVSGQAAVNTVPSQSIYPPDAVITTTTTVDTTKSAAAAKPAAEAERDSRETFFDIDGFYDKFEG